MKALVDPFQRAIDYLRLSVTDRCNLRCVYCLPEAYSAFTPGGEALADDEIVELTRAFAELGFTKLRVTGGEPLVRPGVAGLMRRLAAVRGFSDLALSTNGMLLAPLARELSLAGLRRVNISLDTLDEAKFAAVTRHGRLKDVLEGLEAAVEAGLSPVKLNVVVARGMNEGEVGEFARLTSDRPLHVRFIELMPMGETGFFDPAKVVGFEELFERAGPLEALPRDEWPAGHGPARVWRRPGARGTVGFISALSCNFCGSCNRLRLSARGVLVPCLDGEEGVSLREALRSGGGRTAVKRLIRDVIARKPERHRMLERVREHPGGPRYMVQIGG